MKYSLKINSKATIVESAESKHSSVITLLKEIGKPWGIDKGVDIPFPKFGNSHIAICELKKQLGNGVKATMMYRFRNMLYDHHSCDDTISYEFDQSKIDYYDLINSILPLILHKFNAYRSALFPEELIYTDFSKSRNVNLRHSIYRFYPVMYLGNELCLKMLGLAAESIKID